MRKLLYIVCIFILACDNESAGDCFQTSGNIIQKEIEVSSFSKILVNQNIEMILSQGDEQRIIVETGENLMNEVKVEVIDDQLILTDNNSCNYFRAYNTTKIYVNAPHINEIFSSTQYDIKSEGVLTYPDLTILSEDFNYPGTQNIGDFRLNIQNNSLSVFFNNLSNCFITGETERLTIQYFSGNGRFEGKDFIASSIDIYHRGSNDIIIHPLENLSGDLYGTGDLISVNTPESIDVTEHYRGKLLFRN